MIIERQKCRHWNTCSAPLCPMDEQSLRDGIWYPQDEEVCILASVPRWVKRQRKLAQFKSNNNRYFTHEMLNRLTGVRAGTTGLDSDKEDEPQLTMWLEAHPGKIRVQSEEEKQRGANQLRKWREKNKAVKEI